jgi:uracil phosphoribosyltransferase
MISSPQGIENVFKKFPAITLIVAAVDSHLNERGYIVPGMGDAGDRIYNT